MKMLLVASILMNLYVLDTMAEEMPFECYDENMHSLEASIKEKIIQIESNKKMEEQFLVAVNSDLKRSKNLAVASTGLFIASSATLAAIGGYQAGYAVTASIGGKTQIIHTIFGNNTLLEISKLVFGMMTAGSATITALVLPPIFSSRYGTKEQKKLEETLKSIEKHIRINVINLKTLSQKLKSISLDLMKLQVKTFEAAVDAKEDLGDGYLSLGWNSYSKNKITEVETLTYINLYDAELNLYGNSLAHIREVCR